MSRRRGNPLFVVVLLFAGIVIGFSSLQVPVNAQVITLQPPVGPTGTSVTVTGTGFWTGTNPDTSCTITGNNPSLIFSYACGITGAGALSGATFVVGPVSMGSYTVTVTGYPHGDAVSATFTVISASITLWFSINSIIVTGGPPGSTVSVLLKSGQFSSGDTSCSISSFPSGLFQTSACHIANGNNLNGTFFVVAPVANGSSYQVQVRGNLGDIGTGVFTVIVSPQVTLNPNIGQPGQTISFLATGLLTTDTSCSLNATAASPSAGHLLSSPSCSISGGTATGSFVVASTATADGSPYKVTVIGNPGNDRVSAFFTVVPIIVLTPNNGALGTFVSITGAGFSSQATSCNGLSNPVPLTDWTKIQCVITPSGTGEVSGSFTVGGAGATPAGIYVVTVSDNAAPKNNASAFFTVGAPTAQITIFPNIGLATAPGPTSAGITGYGFNVNDNSCRITAGGVLVSTYTCNMSGGTVGGSFTVSSSAAPGIYLVTVNASIGATPNDFASNYFEVASTSVLTTTTTPTTTSVTTTTATSLTTSIPVTLTTTTFTSTGISTDISYTITTTTFTGQSTSSISTITTATSVVSSITSTTTTTSLTDTTTLGLLVHPPLFSSQGFEGNVFGLISLMSLLGWVLVRRSIS